MNTILSALLCAILSAFPEIEAKIDLLGLVLEKLDPEDMDVDVWRSRGELSGELEVGFAPWARPFAKFSIVDNTLFDYPCLESDGFGPCMDYADSLREIRTYRGEGLRLGWKFRPFRSPGLQGIEIAPYYRYSRIAIHGIPQQGQDDHGKEVRTDAFGIGLDWHIQLSRNILVEPFWYRDWSRRHRGSAADASQDYEADRYDLLDRNRFGLHVGVVF